MGRERERECVCVCVCERERKKNKRQRQRQRSDRKNQKAREGGNARSNLYTENEAKERPFAGTSQQRAEQKEKNGKRPG